MYYLIDLERSILSGSLYYWKPNRRGYTYKIESAGKYSEIEAEEIISQDFDNHTLKVLTKAVDKLLEEITDRRL